LTSSQIKLPLLPFRPLRGKPNLVCLGEARAAGAQCTPAFIDMAKRIGEMLMKDFYFLQKRQEFYRLKATGGSESPKIN
jgi:hypothetical protein